MRIDFKWTPLPLLAVLVGACSALSNPDDRAVAPRGDGASMGALESDDPPRGSPWRPPPVFAPFCQTPGRTFPDCGADAGLGIDAGLGGDAGIDAGVGTDAGSDAGSCEAAGLTFPAGSDVPSGDDCNTCGCDDGRLICTERACDPVFCALFIEASDGVCTRFPLDPCITQDPDCTGTPGTTEPDLLP
jgi:hypothetical protein